MQTEIALGPAALTEDWEQDLPLTHKSNQMYRLQLVFPPGAMAELLGRRRRGEPVAQMITGGREGFSSHEMSLK
jgi:hypothetical protein